VSATVTFLMSFLAGCFGHVHFYFGTLFKKVNPLISDVHYKDTIPKIRNIYSHEKELCDLSPYVHIHVSVSDIYIPTIGQPILLQENMWTDPGNI
jgi:hypothetical protein